MDQHYHPVIHQRLRQLFAARDWTAVQAYLEGLSNAHFRTAGYIIGERVLTDVPSDLFWEATELLIIWQPKAFTVTLAKAAAPRFAAGTLSIDDAGFRQLAATLSTSAHTIDRQKLLKQWLPAITEPTTMENLFALLGENEPHKRVEYLLHVEGLTAAFVLLRALCFEEHDRPWLTNVCRQVIRRAAENTFTTQANLAFNLASLIRTYFDLTDVKGVFSLNLQPYELSRIDSDFDVFRRIVTKV